MCTLEVDFSELIDTIFKYSPKIPTLTQLIVSISILIASIESLTSCVRQIYGRYAPARKQVFRGSSPPAIPRWNSIFKAGINNTVRGNVPHLLSTQFSTLKALFSVKIHRYPLTVVRCLNARGITSIPGDLISEATHVPSLA